MRQAPLWIFLAIALVGFARPVHAEEGEAPEPPAYSAEDMVFTDKELPEGWKPCPADETLPAVAPTEAALMHMGEAIGLDEDTLYVESRAIRNGDKLAVVSLIDIDTDPAAMRKALEAKAESGWTMLDLGSPMRPLVVWGSDIELAKEMASWQREIAVRLLADTSMAKLMEQSLEGFKAARMYMDAALAIEPRAGVIAAIQGFILQNRDTIKAFESWRHALKGDTPIPAEGQLRLDVVFTFGQALLMAAAAGEVSPDQALPAALEVLLDAKAREKEFDLKVGDPNAWKIFGNRYNLACVYARLDRKDEALAELEASLEIGKTYLDTTTYKGAHDHAKNNDPDMGPIRDDERFAKVMEKMAPPEGTDG